VSEGEPGARPVPRRGAFAYFDLDEEAKAHSLFQILREDGSADETGAARFDEALCRRLYDGMIAIRVIDARMMALQRQGRIGFYGEAVGQEAAVVGSAATSEPDDWIVPALREAGVGLFRGMALESYVAQIFGNALDPTRGRQMPCHPIDRERNYVVMSSCVATQIPHAVGVAMAMKIRGDRGRCCYGYMGDGATSEADFHVAMNFAGVYKVPVVFLCNNNQWAISTPCTMQTASETFAIKSLAYGMPGVRVDGNDVLAVYSVVKDAVERARRGEGPTFVEALTYRVSAHSSSDDPTRYRDERVTEQWKAKDPVLRLKRYLVSQGLLDEADDERLRAEVDAEVRDAVAAEEPVGPPSLRSMVEDVYAEVPAHLEEQLAEIEPLPRQKLGGVHA
jgi:pyruvate dehydrogenase E1 component alpha subunit/2-oxoisovalerate dehydrogenase E1 component alpha subunit